MADTRKPRRVGPLPWQAKLRMARNDRQQDAIAEARRPRSITYRFLEDAEDRVFVDPGTPAAPSTAGAERTGSAIERAQARAALALFARPAARPLTPEQLEAFKAAFVRSVGADAFPLITQAKPASPEKLSDAAARLLAALTRACKSLLGDREIHSSNSCEREPLPKERPPTPDLPSPVPPVTPPGSAQPLPPAQAAGSE